MLDGDVIDVCAELICVTRFQGNAQKIQKFWQKVVRYFTKVCNKLEYGSRSSRNKIRSEEQIQSFNLELSLIQQFFQLKQSIDQCDTSDLIYPFKFPRSS